MQAFVIQLRRSARYLPTGRAVQVGAYGAMIQRSRIVPDGGQVLAGRTADEIGTLWPEPR